MILVHLDDGSVFKVKGDRWTEPPAQPSAESLFVVVFSENKKIACFSPTEVNAIGFENMMELADDDAD